MPNAFEEHALRVSDRSDGRTTKVLLVSPATPDTFWSFKHVMRFISKKAAFPPLGLITVAAMLPKSWKLKLVDLNVSRLTDAAIDWADYVFLSAMIAGVAQPSLLTQTPQEKGERCQKNLKHTRFDEVRAR